MTPADKFWTKVDKGGGGCWIWKGSHGGTMGYGMFYFNGRMHNAHRVAWILAYGEIPPSAEHHGTFCVLHRCDNPKCVNPNHLFLGTNRDNAIDREKKGRGNKAERISARAIKQRSQTHCKHGHPLKDGNLYLTPDGRRDCRVCRRKARRLYKSKLREQRAHA